jgi:hypothetical protein
MKAMPRLLPTQVICSMLAVAMGMIMPSAPGPAQPSADPGDACNFADLSARDEFQSGRHGPPGYRNLAAGDGEGGSG